MENAKAQTMEDQIVVEIEIAAAPERVFRALTDPQQLISWFGGSKCWELDLRVGGKWLATGWDKSCGDWEMKGEVIDLNPPSLLAYTWWTDTAHDRGQQTTVRYDLERTDKGTRVRVTHSGFAGNREALEDYRGGWAVELELLRTYLANIAID